MNNKEKKSPAQLWYNTDTTTNPKHFAPFGCPAYVLRSELQTNKTVPKWSDRARAGMYIGRSASHARNVALIMDIATGHVSPQFHVAFDQRFATVGDIKVRPQWQRLAGLLSQRTSDDEAKQMSSKGHNIAAPTATANKQAMTTAQGDSNKTKRRRIADPEGAPEGAATETPEGGPHYAKRSINETATRKMSRPTKPVDRLTYMTSECIEREESIGPEGEILSMETILPNNEYENPTPLHVLQASADPDTMYYHEAMYEPDRDEFRKAMRSEWHDQHNNGNFSIVSKSHVPQDATILPAVWAMRRKRCIKTRRVKKYKARLNVDGSKMIYGKHYEQTYAPVAAWSTVRLVLTLSLALNWHTTQLDYVQAYPQAPVKQELYMQIPVGINLKTANRKTHVLKRHQISLARSKLGKYGTTTSWTNW